MTCHERRRSRRTMRSLGFGARRIDVARAALERATTPKQEQQVSDATEFLNRWIKSSVRQKPSITLTTCQPPDLNLPPGRWTSGIVNYSVGVNGTLTRDSAGNPSGLRFAFLTSVFSDRLVSPGPNPAAYQRFSANSRDTMEISLALDGDAVRADVHNITWGARWSALTTMTDPASNQLIFLDVPPAGPVPLRAIMVVSLQATGQVVIL